MYFIDGKQRYIINRDWLSFSVRARTRVDTLQFRIPPFVDYEELTGTNSYKRRAIVTDKANDKILTILWLPYSPLIDRQLVFVEVGNAYLYGKLESALLLLESMFDFDYGNISRYDVCCDFNPTSRQKSVIRRLGSRECYIQRFTDGSAFYRDGQLNCVSYGGSTSMVKIKCYNKTLELKVGGANVEKPYIVSQWKELYMDVYNVWRWEFSLNSISSILMSNQRVSIRDVMSDEYMCELFISLYVDKCKIKIDTGKVRKSSNPDVSFLKFPNYKHLKISKKVSEDEGNVMLYAKEVMHLIKEIDESKVIKGSERLLRKYTDVIMSMRNPHLDRYLNKVYGIDIARILEDWLFGSSTTVKYYGG